MSNARRAVQGHGSAGKILDESGKSFPTYDGVFIFSLTFGLLECSLVFAIIFRPSSSFQITRTIDSEASHSIPIMDSPSIEGDSMTPNSSEKKLLASSV